MRLHTRLDLWRVTLYTKNGEKFTIEVLADSKQSAVHRASMELNVSKKRIKKSYAEIVPAV